MSMCFGTSRSSANMFWMLVLLVLADRCRTQDSELYFSQSPKDATVVAGKSITLPCQVTPNQGVTYYWEMNGSRIFNTTRRFQQGSKLHITRVDRERDSGQFTCIARDSKGLSITSSVASLNIQWMEENVEVQLQSPESASYISAGMEVVLRCHVEASGEVHYEWFRNANRLTKNARLEIKKKRLHIKDVNPSDNGIYRCTARNEANILRHSSKNFALAVAGNQTALIQRVPKDQLVKKGSTAVFQCSYLHSDAIEWYFKDSPVQIETDNRIKVHPNGTLEIRNVEEADKGLYNCVGIRGESSEVPQSYTAELHLAYIHDLSEESFEPTISPSGEEVVAEHSMFQLTCLEPKSRPLAKKFWVNGKGHTISDKGDVKVDDDGRLIVEDTRTEHSGKYTCVAENIAGRTEKSFQLIVTTKATIINEPESVTVDENEPSTLHCHVETKSPQFTAIKWRKDGKTIKHDVESAHQRVKVFKHNGTLTLSSTKTSDRGEYVCEVHTTGFEPLLSKPATISVIEQLKFAPEPVNKKLELNSMTKLHCKAQGTPPPIVRWEKLGSPLPNHIRDINGTLHFNGVQSDDKGKYLCRASNSQGSINATVDIDVVVAPKFSVLPKNPTEAQEGASVMIDCVVEGDPKPTIQWDKNLKMNDFDKTRFVVMENGTLFIKEVRKEDENSYGCTAGSSAGLNRKEVRLIVYPKDGFFPRESENSTVTKAVLITMSVAAAYIILVVGLMVWCRYRRKSRKLPITDGIKVENGDVDTTELKEAANGHVPGPSKVANGDLKEGQRSDGAETTNSQGSGHSKKSKCNYDNLAFNRSNLKDSKLIGRGEFGDIMAAKVLKKALSGNDEDKDDKEMAVMVKTLKITKDENALMEFKREIDMFMKLSHGNVTKLIGLCREAEPHYLILEYTDWGDLKQFLVATQKDASPSLTPVQCVATLQQIARAMEHISNSRFVHRDLAARNCLITSKLLVKVGLPRLTRDPYSQEYCKHSNQIIPLRWMPHEAVYEDEYSTKSDVYSFGVVAWEVFQKGELPFPKLNDNSILNKLKEKSLQWKFHEETPAQLQKIQEQCLDTDPSKRPTFAQLSKTIEEILKSM